MAETIAHSEVPGGRGFPPFQSEHFASQLVWLAMSFVLLYVLMSRIALPRIGAIMAERGRLISEDLAAAERLKEQSNAANLAYETALADARARAQTIAGSTREQQLREAEDMHKRLESQLHERLAVAEQSIAKSRGAAMSNVRTIAGEATAAIVDRLIGQRPAEAEIAAALGGSAKS
jgi:F-type H+-transporting ATPase subunit b